MATKAREKKPKLPAGLLIRDYSMTEVGARVKVHTMVKKYGCHLVGAPAHDAENDVWRYSYVDPSIPSGDKHESR
jgi:hypothetical protein